MHQKECAALPKQPTPRKGTETALRTAGRRRFRETTHTPQGDGNKALEILKFCNVDEILFTPQGDGNSHHSGRMLIKTGNNPHPARGRKLGWCLLGLRGAAWKQPTPRKGTETRHTLRRRQSSNRRNNPHPARGRKTICVYIAEIGGETIHIPDRGQLTKKERETR